MFFECFTSAIFAWYTTQASATVTSTSTPGTIVSTAESLSVNGYDLTITINGLSVKLSYVADGTEEALGGMTSFTSGKLYTGQYSGTNVRIEEAASAGDYIKQVTAKVAWDTALGKSGAPTLATDIEFLAGKHVDVTFQANGYVRFESAVALTGLNTETNKVTEATWRISFTASTATPSIVLVDGQPGYARVEVQDLDDNGDDTANVHASDTISVKAELNNATPVA